MVSIPNFMVTTWFLLLVLAAFVLFGVLMVILDNRAENKIEQEIAAREAAQQNQESSINGDSTQATTSAS